MLLYTTPDLWLFSRLRNWPVREEPRGRSQRVPAADPLGRDAVTIEVNLVLQGVSSHFEGSEHRRETTRSDEVNAA
jgi:hypothetical protein